MSALRHSTRRRHRSRGQGLVEFALVLPILLLIALGILDFGRLFYSYITVTNAARVAANYAGVNPGASWAANSAYDQLVRGEGLGTLAAICPLTPGPSTPTPTFADSVIDQNNTTKDPGDRASVSVSCRFQLITPVLGQIFGNGVTISHTATFPIRAGAFQL